MSSKTWTDFIDANGDFELPNFLYHTINDLLKMSLDLGVLLSNDSAKLRAYKEQVKSIFKKRWMDVAAALECFDIIVPCGCAASEFCRICGGSRFLLNEALSPERMREIAVVLADQDPKISQKLHEGLERAMREVKQ